MHLVIQCLLKSLSDEMSIIIVELVDLKIISVIYFFIVLKTNIHSYAYFEDVIML